MKTGFTFDERILSEISIDEFLYLTKRMDMDSMEFLPHEKLISIREMSLISNFCNKERMDINYHIPYFVDRHNMELNEYHNNEENIKNNHLKFLKTISGINPINKPVITIHGAFHEQNKIAFENTINFIDWFKTQSSCEIALEILPVHSEGNMRQDIFKISEETGCGICWDICHDVAKSAMDNVNIPENILEKVINVHVHGYKYENDLKHLPLVESDINFYEQLTQLKNHGYSGSINIELMAPMCGGKYLEYLEKDVKYLRNLLNSL